MAKEIKINGFWLTFGLLVLFIALAAISNVVDQIFKFETGTSIEYIGGFAFIVLVGVFIKVSLNLVKRRHEQESSGSGAGAAGGTGGLLGEEESKLEIEVSENTSLGYSGESGGGGDGGGDGGG